MRHATAIVILLTTAMICLGIDHKRAIEEQYKGKVLYISHVPGLYGIFAGASYEHTYHVTSDGAVKFEKVKYWPFNPNELMPPGTQVEIRNVKVKDDQIEMTIRSSNLMDLGLKGGIIGVSPGLTLGGMSQRADFLEVNLKFDLGKDVIKTGDMPTIRKFVKTLISEERPQVNIQVGMKLEEVTAQLGEPQQQIQVENKLLLVYPQLTVVIENDKVIEVKVK